MNKSIKSFREIKYNRKNKGFSMAEMLIVVALIILTLSIAIPNVVAYKKNLKLMHADDVAREIFLSAQNELVYQKSVEQLTDIYKYITTSGNGCKIAVDEFGNRPDNQRSLYYVESGSEAMNYLLGGKKLDAISAGGYYYIEVDPSSANVYSVFYTEKNIAWNELNNTTNNLRKKEGRREYYSKAVVGYYAAALEDWEYPEAEHIKIGNLSIINSEELYVEFDAYVRQDVLPAHTRLTLTLSDEEGHSHVDTVSLSPDANGGGLCVKYMGEGKYFDGENESFKKYTVRRLIDSMENAYRFQTLLPDSSPGTMITATVSFQYLGESGENTVKEEISDYAVSNSSFARAFLDPTGNNSVGICYIRHLYNIQGCGLKAIYVQGATLDFDADNYSWTGGKYEDAENEALNPLSKFPGVELPDGSEYRGNGDQKILIKNFKSDCGIFSSALDCDLLGVYVVNHQVQTTTGVTKAGGLIGSMQGGSITDCRVYQENGESFIKASESAAGALYVGGLVGKVIGATTMKESCAAIPVVSASVEGYCGGFVGFAGENVSFSKCYGNTTDLKGKYAGGFAGSLSNCEVQYCYAVAETFSDDTKNAAGFCADMQGGSLEQSYALIGSIKTSDKSTNRMALIQDDSGPNSVNNCYFNYDGKFHATQKAVGKSAAYNEIVEALFSEDEWEYDYDTSGSVKDLEFSKPFSTEGDYEYMKDAAYTCLRIKGMPHYGNWPDASCTIEYLPNVEIFDEGNVKKELEKFHRRKILTSESTADSELRDYVWKGNYPKKTENGTEIRYVFKCWEVKGQTEPGEKTEYYPGDPIQVSGKSLVLEAKWERGVTILYDTNAGTNATFSGEKIYSDPRLRYKGEIVEVLFTDSNGQPPTHKQGYQFYGWNSEKDRNPPEFTYVSEENEPDEKKKYMKVNPAEGTYEITLYAFWQNAPKESHLKIQVNNKDSEYRELELTLGGVIPVKYAKPGDYFVNARTGQYDLLLRGKQTGIKVVVDSSGARFVQNGKLLHLLSLYTLKVQYRLNGTNKEWANDASSLKSLFNLDRICINDEEFLHDSIIYNGKGVYESPVMLPDSVFYIYVNEPTDINKAAKTCKTTPDLNSIETKSVHLQPSTTNVVKSPVTVYADYCSIEFKSKREVVSLPPTVIVRGGSNYRCPEDELELREGTGIFLKWSSSNDEKKGVLEALPGGNIYIEDAKELILYAKWKDSITVTYETNFYKFGHGDVQGCNIEDVSKMPEDAFYEAQLADDYNYVSRHLVYSDQAYRTHEILNTKLQRKGYYFVGWGTSRYANEGGTTYWPRSLVKLEDDLVLYAQWAYDNNYTIVYLMSEEEFSGGVSNTTFSSSDSTVRLAHNRYTRAGKEFIGWHGYIGGSKNKEDPYRMDFDAGKEYAGKDLYELKKCSETGSKLIILYGSWKDLDEKDSYEVKFHLVKMKAAQNTSLYAYAGQDYTAVFECEGGYRPPDKISVKVKGEELTPNKDYKWNPTTRELRIYKHAIRGPVTIIASAIPEKHRFSYLNVDDKGNTTTLYTEDVEYNTYNAVKSIEEIEEIKGSKVNVRDGYLFTGWNTKKDGSGTMYQPGASIFVQGEVNLYACWKESDVVGAGIYNGYLYYYYQNSDNSSHSQYYCLTRGETQTIEDGETLAVINDGGQVHFTYDKDSREYSYYYCIMLQKNKQLSEYKIFCARNNTENYEEISQKNIQKLEFTSTSGVDYVKNYEGFWTSRFIFEYGDEDYYYYYFKDTVSGKPEITNIKITEAKENGKSAIFDFSNSLRPTNSTSETITGSKYFGNDKKYPKVDVYNGSVPRIDRSYANFFKNEKCRSEFRVHLDANNENYQYNSINLVDENGISVTTPHNLIKGIEGQDYIFNPDAMADLRSGTYTVIFDYSNYQNDPSFELHVYDEDLEGYRYIQMEIESLMAYCPHGSSNYYAQFADVAFYGDEERISQYKFEDASCVYLNSTGWASSNKHEDISMIIDNNPRTKMCSYQTKYNINNGKSGIKLVIDVGDGYQFSPNIYGYTGLITAGDSEGYPWRMPNEFSFSGTNDSLENPKWTPIDTQSLYNAKNAFDEEKKKGQDSYYVEPNDWLKQNIPFYWLKLKNEDEDFYINESKTDLDNTKKLRNFLNKHLLYNLVGTGYNMQPTKPHRIETYSLTYDTNAPEGAKITWYDPKNPKKTDSKNLDLEGYGDQVIGFCIPQWKDENGKTVKYFLGWSKDKNATEADYTSGSHINLIANTTLYAVWSEVSPTFALTYQANDSESAPAGNMPVNTNGSGKYKISSLIPEREGYKFIGWIWLGDVDNDHKIQDDPFQKDNLGLYQPSDSILLNQNVTLYARWVKSKCVTVIAPGCKITSPGWTMGSNGYKYYVPARSGCSFTFSVDEGVEFKSISVKNKKGEEVKDKIGFDHKETNECTIPSVTEDLIVTIDVEMKTFNVQVSGVTSITLQDTKKEITGDNKVVTFDVSYGETAAFYFTATGQMSLKLDRGTTGLIITKENDEKYLCRIPKVKEDLTLSVVEGLAVELKSSEEATYSITVYIPKGENSILPTADMVGFFAPEGQRFAGWKHSNSTEVDYPGGKFFNTEAEGKNLVDGTILYPYWADEDTCTITIKYDDPNDEGETKVVKKGSWVVLDIPEREDQIFVGWKDFEEDIVYSDGFYANSDNMTVIAQWEKACIVRFNGNGGKPFVDYLKVAEGSSIELPQAVWDGREFLGWFDPGGKEVSGTIIINSDIVFKAKWRDLVRYHLNPDDPEEFVWVDTPAQKTYQTSKYDSISGGYTRDNARFIGWADSSDLRTSDVKYYIEEDTISDGTADLYAVWLSGTLYFERQCLTSHKPIQEYLKSIDLEWDANADKLFYRIALDLSKEDAYQVGVPCNADKTKRYTTPVLGDTIYGPWWNSVVIPDTITGGYKNWNVQIKRDKTGLRNETPMYYPNTSGENDGKGTMTSSEDKIICTMDSSQLGSYSNYASYGIRDDKIVQVTISFGKRANGEDYLYKKTIPFGKLINKDPTHKYENIVIFPYSPAPTALQEFTGVTETPEVTDTTEVTETQETPNTSEVQEVTNIPEITEVTVP